MPTSLVTLQAAVRRLSENRDWGQLRGAKDFGIDIITEAGGRIQQSCLQSPEQAEALFEETRSCRTIESGISEVLFFVLRLADRYSIDVASSAEEQLLEGARRYPTEEARGRNERPAREDR